MKSFFSGGQRVVTHGMVASTTYQKPKFAYGSFFIAGEKGEDDDDDDAPREFGDLFFLKRGGREANYVLRSLSLSHTKLPCVTQLMFPSCAYVDQRQNCSAALEISTSG